MDQKQDERTIARMADQMSALWVDRNDAIREVERLRQQVRTLEASVERWRKVTADWIERFMAVKLAVRNARKVQAAAPSPVEEAAWQRVANLLDSY